MAVTTTLRQRGKMGNMRLNVVDVAITSETYATGGISVAAAKLGLGLAYVVLPSPAAGYIFEYDHANSKLKAFTPVKAQSAHSHVNTATTALTSTPTVTPTETTKLLSFSGPDIKGSANTDSENVDSASAPTNSTGISAQATVATTWAKGAITNPDIGRNIGIVIANDSVGSLNLYEGVMTFTITGTYRGVAQTDAITFTSTSGNKAVANSPNYRYKYGVKPFDTVTNIVLDNVPADGFKISACAGSKIGLPTDLATPDEDDVKKITKNAANLAATGIVDTTNMTVNLGALADNDDFIIVYDGVTALTAVEVSVATTGTVTMTNATGGAISAAAATEVGNGAAITATPRLIAIGI